MLPPGRILFGACQRTYLLLSIAAGCSGSEMLPEEPPDSSSEFSVQLEQIRRDTPAVALAALLWRFDRIAVEAAVGKRKVDAGATVTSTDRWHLGSCGKAMTATVVALSVERGELDWTTTLEQAFGAAAVHPDLHQVTMADLLRHRSGLRRNFRADVVEGFFDPGSPDEHRRVAVADLLLEPPSTEIGSFAYSNAGYTVAGAMLEHMTGVSFEQLASARLFEPLGMSSCGFGIPHAGDTSAPWGHRLTQGALVLGAQRDPLAESPSGGIHCSLRDWATFARLHMDAARGQPRLLSSASFDRLHGPPAGADYAMGWYSLEREWAAGRVLTHAGSIGTYSAVVWVAPRLAEFTLAVANQDDDLGATDEALDRVSTEISQP